MRTRLIALTLSVCAAVMLGSCIFGPGEANVPPPPSVYKVVKVQLVPEPEGPPTPSFTEHPAQGDAPLGGISAVIPHPLPSPISQSCTVGSDVVITLGSGDTRTYGPCQFPASIVRLRKAMLRYLARHHP